MTAVIIYCDGRENGPRHERCPIARYDGPYRVGNRESIWEPTRTWQQHDSIVTVPEFERWGTDDDDAQKSGRLSLPQLRRLFRYRCEQCKPKPFDLQRHNHNHDFDVELARDHVLDAVADRGEIALRHFAVAWKYQISRTRRR